MAASDFPDWWDGQKKQSEEILSDWVQDNPQWWAIAVATTVSTSMDLGAGMVDVLRFGEGAAEGGFKGYGKDGLRLLMLLGPLARAGGVASRFLTPLFQSRNLRLAVQVQGVTGPCTYQAVNNAVSIVKRKNLFITVEDMAAAVGKNISRLSQNPQGKYQLGAWIDDLVPVIRDAGVRVREVKGLTSVDEVAALAQRETGPVVFAIRTEVITAAGKTEEIFHSVIAMRTPGGSVRYADYGNKFVGSLKELLSQWGTPSAAIELAQSSNSATVIGAATLTGEWAMKLATGSFAVMEGVHAIETPNGAEFAMPVNFVASTAPVQTAPIDSSVIKGSFEAYKSRAKGHAVIRLPEVAISGGRKSAPQSDWLTGVQFRLNALGFGAGQVDGIMGPRTKKAVIAFQRSHPPLQVDGIPGPKTQAKLVDACGY